MHTLLQHPEFVVAAIIHVSAILTPKRRRVLTFSSIADVNVSAVNVTSIDVMNGVLSSVIMAKKTV